MTAREPQEIADVAVQVGAKKVHRSWDKVLLSSFLAGAYIAFGAMVAITVSSGLKPAIWGTLPTLFTGIAFTLGLVLVLLAGSDLYLRLGEILAIFFPIMAFVAMGFDHVVANMFFLPAAIFAGVPGIDWGNTAVNWLLAGTGNLVGAVVFVAGTYWYLFLKDRPAAISQPQTPQAATQEPASARSAHTEPA